MLKMYVLTRKDLGTVYSLVQGTHAVAEYLIKNKKTDWQNGTLIMLSVTNEYLLKKWIQKLTEKKIEFIEFHEPDLKDQLTAIACVLSSTDGSIFEKLPLA
jgi:hypothetical protein